MKAVVRWLAVVAMATAVAGCSDNKAESPKEYAPLPAGPKGLKGAAPGPPPAPPPRSK